MTYVARLYSGDQLVRLLPLDHAGSSEIRTPRLLPPRLAELDPEPSPVIAVDVWTWTGEHAEGWITAERWVLDFGTAYPADTDRRTMQVPVTWLRYQHA